MTNLSALSNQQGKRAKWRQLMMLFEEVSELPVSQRKAHLKSKALDEVTLNKLEKMLNTLDHTMSILDTPLSSRISLKENWYAEEWLGKELNGFKLDTLLHEGSIAGVFLASQEEPVRRQVVIKLIRPEAPNEYLDFFRYEQQALAKLSHPNIATIHTVEKNEDGLSFIVMEHINGKMLSDYCESEKLSLRERLRLFLDICDAISYSHQRGILHRDLKSSNILVRNFEGKPTPTIIDFGISSDLNEKIEWSEESLMGTPEYMSPEHVLNLNDMDARADVYSLGMVLFSLLAGRIPFDREPLQRLDKAKRLALIAEYETPLPSAHLAMLKAEHKSANDKNGLATSQISTQLNVTRELDYIYLKATQKDREQRYQSVAELAADVRRYLKSDAVLAHPSSFWYLSKKFLNRHALAVFAGVTILLFGSVFLFKLVEQNHQIKLEVEKAQIEKQNAEEVASMIVETVGFADPRGISSKGQATVVGMLDHGHKNLLNTKDLDADVRANLLLSLSTAFLGIGESAKANDINQHLLDNISNYETPIQCRILITASETALYDVKDELQMQLAKRAVEMCDADQISATDAVISQTTLAEAFLAQAKFEKSVEIFNTALQLHETLIGEDTPLLARIHHRMGKAETFRHNIDDARAFYKKAGQIMTKFFDHEHAKVVEIELDELQNLCIYHNVECSLARITTLQKRIKNTWGENSRYETGLLTILANKHFSDDNFSLAIEAIKENLEVIEYRDETQGRIYFVNLMFLSTLHLFDKNNTEALHASTKAYELVSADSADFSEHTIGTVSLRHAASLMANGDFQGAFNLVNPIVSGFEKEFQDKGDSLALSYSLRSVLHAKLGRFKLATEDAQRYFTVKRNNINDNSEYYQEEELLIADCLILYVRVLEHWDQQIFDQLEEKWAAFLAYNKPVAMIPPRSFIAEFIAGKQ